VYWYTSTPPKSKERKTELSDPQKFSPQNNENIDDDVISVKANGRAE